MKSPLIVLWLPLTIEPMSELRHVGMINMIFSVGVDSCCFKSASCRGSDVSTTSFFVNLYRLPSSAIASYSSRAEVIKRSIFFEFSLPERSFIIRSEEHTSELQSLMRISYAVFCLKKKKTKNKLYIQ